MLAIVPVVTGIVELILEAIELLKAKIAVPLTKCGIATQKLAAEIDGPPAHAIGFTADMSEVYDDEDL